MNNLIYLIFSFGIILSIILWFVFNHFIKLRNDKFNINLMLIVFVGLYLRISFAVLTPTFYAPDEQSHYNYAKYLVQNKVLPIQISQTNAYTNDWEYYQPPLYYLLLAPIYSIFQSGNETLDTYRSVLSMRLFSIFLWIITIYFSFKILKLLQIDNIFLKTFIISMVSLLPSYTYISSMINNDNLLTAMGSIIIYLSIKEINFKNAILLGLVLGLAMLTKLSAVIFFIYIVITLIYYLYKKELSQGVIINYSIRLTIGFLIWLPIGLRNYKIYGSFTAENIANIPYHWDSLIYAIYSTLLYIQKSFWAISGIHNNVSSFFPIFGIALFLFSTIGFINNFIKKENICKYVTNNQNMIHILGITIIFHLILIIRFGLLYAQSQGRFLFPLLIPIAIILGTGLMSFKLFRKEYSYLYVSSFFMVYSTSFAIYSLITF